MIGRIQCFMPALRRGVLRTETGEELAFRVPEELGELQGGDVVEFELGGNGRPFVSRVRLRHRWADVLNAEERALVNQFHQTIQIQR